MSSKHYAGYSDALSANALVRMTIDDSELRQGLESTKDAFKRLQMNLFSIGRNMETIGRQIAAPFASATKVFADFDDQMRRVAAVTGASFTIFACASIGLDDVLLQNKTAPPTTARTAAKIASLFVFISMPPPPRNMLSQVLVIHLEIIPKYPD